MIEHFIKNYLSKVKKRVIFIEQKQTAMTNTMLKILFEDKLSNNDAS
jgi:hypothetical protein